MRSTHIKRHNTHSRIERHTGHENIVYTTQSRKGTGSTIGITYHGSIPYYIKCTNDHLWSIPLHGPKFHSSVIPRITMTVLPYFTTLLLHYPHTNPILTTGLFGRFLTAIQCTPILTKLFGCPLCSHLVLPDIN